MAKSDELLLGEAEDELPLGKGVVEGVLDGKLESEAEKLEVLDVLMDTDALLVGEELTDIVAAEDNDAITRVADAEVERVATGDVVAANVRDADALFVGVGVALELRLNWEATLRL